jgi:hypothetical protein
MFAHVAEFKKKKRKKKKKAPSGHLDILSAI